MKKIICSSALLAVAILLSACTTTLNPEYKAQINQQKSTKSAHTLNLQVEDTRPGNPNMVGTVEGTNYVGTAGMPVSGFHNFKLADPVASYVKTSLSSALEQAGYTINNSAKNALLIRITDSQLTLHDVSMFTTQVNFTMQTQLISSNPTWKTTLNIKGTGNLGLAPHKAYNSALNNAITDLANQIIQKLK